MAEFTIDDLEFFRENKVKQNYLGEYNPDNFWKSLGEMYHQHFDLDQKNEDAKSSLMLDVRPMVARIETCKVESVLEVGCGFGRMLPFVKTNCHGVKKVVGLEFSPTMIENSKLYFKQVKDLKDGDIEIIRGRAQELPFEGKTFDLIYTHVCLTHIPPRDISRVTTEISRVAKNWILHAERFNFPYEHPNPHRWSHMLVPYYEGLGWETVECDTIHEENKTKVYLFKKI